MSKNSAVEGLKIGIEDLRKNIDKYHPCSCQRIAFEVLKEPKVQDAFVDVLSQGYDFDSISCEPFGRDQTKVTFRFRCRPPKICIVNLCFEVNYDLSLKKIVGDIKHIVC
jgi:hypothetical protein